MALPLRPFLIPISCASMLRYCGTAWLHLLLCPPPIGMGGGQSTYLNSLRMMPVAKYLLHLQRASSRATCRIRSLTSYPLRPLLSFSKRTQRPWMR